MNDATTKTIDLGNNESASIGIVSRFGGGYLALTLSESKAFKTWKGAEAWLARRGYSAFGERLAK